MLHDIRPVLSRRYPLAELVLCPAAVQGDHAPDEIVDALRTLNDEVDVDVIIVARGGGSLEELWAFNTETVARAIYASHAPVVSAVGHETDTTIADLVADVRAPTPSVAAEMVAPDIGVLGAEVTSLAQQAWYSLSYAVSEHSLAVEGLVQRMAGRLPDIAGLRLGVDGLLDQGLQALTAWLERRWDQARGLEAQLAALNPSAVLGRGYAVLTHQGTGATVSSPQQVGPGDHVRATVRGGQFDTRVVPWADGLAASELERADDEPASVEPQPATDSRGKRSPSAT